MQSVTPLILHLRVERANPALLARPSSLPDRILGLPIPLRMFEPLTVRRDGDVLQPQVDADSDVGGLRRYLDCDLNAEVPTTTSVLDECTDRNA